MAISGASDGLWGYKTSTTTTAVRQFTGRVVHVNGVGSGQRPVISLTFGSAGATNIPFGFHGFGFSERTDGTANWASMNLLRGTGNTYNGSLGLNFNYSYASSSRNFTYYLYADISGNVLNFRGHYYGVSFSNTSIISIMFYYDRQDLVTASYPG